MKIIHIFTFSLLLTLPIHSSIAQSTTNELDDGFVIPQSYHFSNSKKLKKIFQEKLKDFAKIIGGRVPGNHGAKMTFTKLDSHAIAGARNEDKHPLSRNSGSYILAADFFMNVHEVTNQEYRAFLNAYKTPMMQAGTYDTLVVDHPVWYSSSDSNHRFNKLNIQVNTRLWVEEMTSHMGDPMMEYYFSHPSFDDYPVVGISYEQCCAFVEWKNNQITATLKTIGFDEPWGVIRMPTREEWYYAAGSLKGNQWLDENQTHKRLYPWDGHSLNYHKDGSYMSNFGRIKDENGLVVKSFYDDGFTYTAPVKNYHPNEYGLYDMAGNVSEWTSSYIDYADLAAVYQEYYQLSNFSGDTAFYNEISKDYPDWALIDSMTVERKTQNAIWRNPHNNSEHRMLYDFVKFTKIEKPIETHNLELLKRYGNVNIVKGGNWWRGPVYLLLSAQQGFHIKDASTTVGMRLALDLDPRLQAILGDDFGVFKNKKSRK